MANLLSHMTRAIRSKRAGVIYLSRSPFLRMMILEHLKISKNKPVYDLCESPSPASFEDIKRKRYVVIAVADPSASSPLLERLRPRLPPFAVECESEEDFRFLFGKVLGESCDSSVFGLIYEKKRYDLDQFVDLLLSISKAVKLTQKQTIAANRFTLTESDVDFLVTYFPKPSSSDADFLRSEQFRSVFSYLLKNRDRSNSLGTLQNLHEKLTQYHDATGDDLSHLVKQIEIESLSNIGAFCTTDTPQKGVFVWNPLLTKKPDVWVADLVKRRTALFETVEDDFEAIDFLFKISEHSFQFALQFYSLGKIKRLLEEALRRCEKKELRDKLAELRLTVRYDPDNEVRDSKARSLWRGLAQDLQTLSVLEVSDIGDKSIVDSVPFEMLLMKYVRFYKNSPSTVESVNKVNNFLQNVLGTISSPEDAFTFMLINEVLAETWYMHLHPIFPSREVIDAAEAMIRTRLFSSETLECIVGMPCNIYVRVGFDRDLMFYLPYAYQLHEMGKDFDKRISNELDQFVDFYCRHSRNASKFDAYDFLSMSFREFAKRMNEHIAKTYPHYSLGSTTELKREIISVLDGPPASNQCHLLPKKEIRHVVLIVVDAMGFKTLLDQLATSTRLRNLYESLQSDANLRTKIISTVFPSTTGVTHFSLLCGCFPAEHGIPADKYRVQEEMDSDTGPVLTESKKSVFEDPIKPLAASIFDELKTRRITSFVFSYTRGHGLGDWLASKAHRYKTEESVDLLRNKFREYLFKTLPKIDRSFSFVQIGDLDKIAHHLWMKERYLEPFFTDVFEAIYEIVTSLKAEQPDFAKKVLFIITADHGLTYPSKVVSLYKIAKSEDGIGNRAIVCYSKDLPKDIGMVLDLEDLQRMEILSSDRRYLPNFVVPRGILVLPFDQATKKAAVHGGLSVDEMFVPLITLEVIP